jgi:hypothetical protein
MLQTVEVNSDYDAARIDFLTASNAQCTLLYGPQGEYNYLLPSTHYAIELDNADNPGQPTYRFTWYLDNLQQSVDTVYNAQVNQGGTVSNPTEWTQIGLYAQSEDVVAFPDILKSDIGKITEIASKLSNRGWATIEEWTSLGRLIAATAEFNSVEWADGR